MSDFPFGGNTQKTREWLDSKNFKNILNEWEADAILGSDKDDIISLVSGENGLRLWGLLNTARKANQGIIICLVYLLINKSDNTIIIYSRSSLI